ncbi:MAG: beta-lactamase domain-containing protein [Limisphaerales bacterium]|nr:MAG: beta-lactamase domain-containing protein [Limisphaerales bacterium]KAG0508740.1 MAG: beta-lactamase domain-containing protein [Limisphaerales bacterium]TXT50390.1 MAG: beta-lactamase domain-containing protein [Limisphaerales bacterium]
MRIRNLNPDADIGASAWWLELDGHRLLMDAGVHPKREGRDSLPLLDLVKHEELDAIAITHCHHDHVGGLPVAIRHHRQAHVLMTELSYFLVERVLHNSVNVMKRQREESGIRDYPLYSHDELDEIAPLFQGFKYNREIEWAFQKPRGGANGSPTLEFFDAGHALGSAGILVRGRRETLFYTGDVCFRDQTILKGARFEDVEADVLIMETTRGNRAPTPGFQREAELDRLIEAIRETLKRKGSVLIPTFALGRTQEILAALALATRAGKLKHQPIYIGGLGRVFTEIYDLESHRTHRQHSNLQLHEALNLIVLEKGQAETMKLAGGRIFVITAGMMSEHTAAHDLAARMMGDLRHGIFFVGYADPDTPGGHLKASKPGKPFLFSPSAGQLTRKCEVRDFDLSAHANRDELLDFVGEVSPRAVLLGHGDAEARGWFAEQIAERHPKIRVIQPVPGQLVEV